MRQGGVSGKTEHPVTRAYFRSISRNTSSLHALGTSNSTLGYDPSARSGPAVFRWRWERRHDGLAARARWVMMSALFWRIRAMAMNSDPEGKRLPIKLDSTSNGEFAPVYPPDDSIVLFIRGSRQNGPQCPDNGPSS